MAFLRTFVERQTKVSESLNFKLCRLDFKSSSAIIHISRVSMSEMCCANELNCASFSLSSSYLKLEPRSVHTDRSESLSYAGSIIMTQQYSRTWFKHSSVRKRDFFPLSISHFDCYQDRFDILLYIAIWHES